jgi:hypothetical protein
MILYGFTMNMINTTCDATHYPDEKIRFKMRWLGFHAPKKKSDRYAKHTHTKHDSRRYTIRQCWAPHTQTQMHGVWYGDDLLSIYLIYPVSYLILSVPDKQTEGFRSFPISPLTELRAPRVCLAAEK